jgi:hypothetical protein
MKTRTMLTVQPTGPIKAVGWTAEGTTQMDGTLVEMMTRAGINPDRARGFIERGWATVNGERVRDPDRQVHKGDRVVLSDPPEVRTQGFGQ